MFYSIIFFYPLRNLIIPSFKIVEAYLQNISRDEFLFRLRIGTVYHEKNFLMIEMNNRIEQDLGNMEDEVECLNQTVTTVTINATCDFALSVNVMMKNASLICQF